MSAFAERARLLLGQQRADLALEQVRKGLAETPDDGDLHFLHALCLHHLDRDQEALDAIAPALAADPDSSPRHWLKGMCLLGLGRHDEARAALEEARKLDPEDADVPAGLAALHAACARWQDALAAAEAGLRLDPEHTQCSNLRAFALSQLGRSGEAATQAEAELARDPDNGWTHAQRGWALLNAGRQREAAESFREALRLEPGLEFARNGLVEALRARSPVYALFLRYFLLMGRLGRHAWLVVVALFLGQSLLRNLAQSLPAWAWLFWSLYGLLVAFVVMTWIVQPLVNFTLWLHPLGRIALQPAEKRQSLVLAGALLVPAGLAAAVLAGALGGSWLPVLVAATFVLPLTFLAEPGLGGRWRAAVAGVLVLLVALAGHWAWCWRGEQALRGEAMAVARAHGIAEGEDFSGRLVEQVARSVRKRAPESQAPAGEDPLPPAVWERVEPWLKAAKRSRQSFDRYLLVWMLGTIACVFIGRRRE